MTLAAEAVGEHGDQHHAYRLHGEARTLRDEYVTALRAPQLLVGLAVNFAKYRLRAVEQHITDAAQAFLQRLHHLRLRVGHDGGCCDTAAAVTAS